MTPILSTCLLLLLFSTALSARASAASASADKSNSNTHDTAEIQGCLQRQDGYFILVNTNNEYQRLSNNKALKALVGHEVRLTGKPEIRTIDTTLPGGASSAIEQRYFSIKTVQDVAPNCQAYGK